MANDWVIDVLADLKSYLETNGMKATAACVEDATLVALTELGSFEAGRGTSPDPDQPIRPNASDEAGSVTWLFSPGDRA